MMKKITILYRRLTRLAPKRFCSLQDCLLHLGLVFSHALAGKALVDVLVDFLENSGLSLWEAVLLTTMLDFTSAVFRVGVTHVSEAYTGRFTVIIFCAGAYAVGLVLFWIYAMTSDLGSLIFAVVLTALGTAGQEPTLREYFDHQINEKVKKKCTKNDKRSRSSGTDNFWGPSASFCASLAAFMGLGNAPWPTTFQILSYVMAATYLFFFLGILCYYPEQRPSGSPLTTIYRVFKAAYDKRRLSYPCSEEVYYSTDNNNQGSNVSEDSLFYRSENNGVVHLLPRDPSCLMFLDKAAIIIRSNSDNSEREERNGEACTVEQVRDVKSLYPIIPFGFMLFGCSLVSASGNTYFIQQAANLDPYVGDFHVSIVSFFVLKSFVSFAVTTILSRKELVKPISSIAVGMFFSVLCAIAAWLVERYRLSLILKDPQKETISLSIMSLTPPFLLLGLMEAFAGNGLVTLVCRRVATSMRKSVGPCAQLLLATESCFSLLFAYSFGVLTNESASKSLLDWYFLFLASLSFGLFCIYVCNSFTASRYDEETQTN